MSTDDIARQYYDSNKYTTTSAKLEKYDEECNGELIITKENYGFHPECKDEVFGKNVEILNNEVQKYFTNKLAKEIDLVSGKIRIYIFLELDSIGNINQVSVKAPHPKLKEVGISMIENISKMNLSLKNNPSSYLKFLFSILYIVE